MRPVIFRRWINHIQTLNKALRVKISIMNVFSVILQAKFGGFNFTHLLICHCFRKRNQFARENDVEQATPMHGWIIGYLYRHRDTPVFQRDIEREFSITRSTVTNILQLMERKGYIERRSVPQDARLKQLVLTEEGICFHEKTMLCFHQTDDYVAGLLTAEENTELLRLLNKLRDALQ